MTLNLNVRILTRWTLLRMWETMLRNRNQNEWLANVKQMKWLAEESCFLNKAIQSDSNQSNKEIEWQSGVFGVWQCTE